MEKTTRDGYIASINRDLAAADEQVRLAPEYAKVAEATVRAVDVSASIAKYMAAQLQDTTVAIEQTATGIGSAIDRYADATKESEATLVWWTKVLAAVATLQAVGALLAAIPIIKGLWCWAAPGIWSAACTW